MVREESCSVLKQNVSRFFDTCLPWFAFWLKNGIFISHDGKSNEALTFLAETQILAGLEVMLILLDICKHFYQLLLSEGYILFILSVHGSEKLSVKFSQKKLGRGLKIILQQPLQIPLPKNYPCMGDVCWFCTDPFYYVTRLYKFPKSCFSWLVVNICLSENCQIGWGNVVFEK